MLSPGRSTSNGVCTKACDCQESGHSIRNLMQGPVKVLLQASILMVEQQGTCVPSCRSMQRRLVEVGVC